MTKLLLALGIFAILASGCSTVKVTDSGNRGVLQQSPVVVLPKPIELPIMPNPIEAGFIWPVHEGKVSSFYGQRRRDFHEGIDIRCNRGSSIFAAKAGTVIYSSRKIKGYGNMIVIRHDDGTSTVYAHNRKNLVKRGSRVTQGQLLGYVGATGKATGPHLHFEIRKGELPQDPLLYLPQIRSPTIAHK